MKMFLNEFKFRNYNFKQKLLIICTIIYLFTLMVFVESGSTLIYSKIAFIITFFVCIVNISVVYLTIYDIFMLVFTIICMLSTFWSPLPDKSLEMGITLIQIFFMFIVFRMGFRKFGNETLFIWIILIAGLGMCIYYLNYYGFSGYINAMKGNLRLGSDFQNTNTIGGAGAFVFLATIYLGYQKCKIWYLISIIPGIIILGAGSRTAIFVSIAGIVVILLNYLYRVKNTNVIKRTLILILILICIKYLIIHISEISFLNSTYEHFKQMFDTLSGKSNLVGSTTYRLGMIKVGWQLFFRNPLIGNGINGTKVALNSSGIPYTVLHNNYIEILADVGLIGFLSYYGVYFLSLKPAIKQISRKHFFPLIMLIMMLIVDIGGVTYYMQRNYLFLIFVTIALENDEEVSKYNETTKFVLSSRH